LDYLEELNPEQRKAVEQIEGPLLVLAGAGSGKTRVITTRITHLIAYYGISPYRILAMTFTNKAASEMKQRVEKVLGSPQPDLVISTFHSFCARFLRREIGFLGRERNFIIFDTQDQTKVLKDVLKRLKLNAKEYPAGILRQKISLRKNNMPDNVFLDPDLEKKIFDRYQSELLTQNALDFDDLLVLTNQILENSDECRQRYSQRFEHIMIDEYQDTNRIQFQLITQLAGDKPNLCVVGDEDQSIYSWRGADIRNILDFENHFKDAKIIKLEQNYRSTQNILTYANRVIVKNKQRKPKKLWTKGSDGLPVSKRRFPRGIEEAESIAERIKMSGMSYRHIAVLYRVNFLSRVLEEVFRRKRIPYQLVGGLKFYDRKEIKDILSYARCIVNTRDWTSFSRAINIPTRGVGSVTLDRIRFYYDQTGDIQTAMEEALSNGVLKGRAAKGVKSFLDLVVRFRASSSTKTPSTWMNSLLNAVEYREHLRKEDVFTIEKREDNINELIESMRELEKQGVKDIAEFLDFTALISDQDQIDDSVDKVSLMTIHAAKGLEFDTIFVMGLEEGIFPNKRALEENEHALEEERRLFYVAVTRAKNTLYLSHSKRRMTYGSYFDNPPSRFLSEKSRPPINPIQSTSIPPKGSGQPHQGKAMLVGDTVVHPVFGKGTVLALSPKGLDMRVTVRFSVYGTRVFLKSKAPFQ